MKLTPKNSFKNFGEYPESKYDMEESSSPFFKMSKETIKLTNFNDINTDNSHKKSFFDEINDDNKDKKKKNLLDVKKIIDPSIIKRDSKMSFTPSSIKIKSSFTGEDDKEKNNSKFFKDYLKEPTADDDFSVTPMLNERNNKKKLSKMIKG